MIRLKEHGSIYVNSIPYLAGVACISGVKIHEFQLQGLIWVIVLIFGLLLLATKGRRVTIHFPVRIWLPWFLYVAMSLLWGSFTLRGNLQSCAQILAPFVVGIVASFSVTDKDRWRRLQRGFVHSLVLISCAFLYFGYGPPGQFRGMGTSDALDTTSGEAGALSFAARTSAMTISVIGGVLLADRQRTRAPILVGWAACLAIVVLSGSRMGTIALLLTSVLSPAYRSTWRRIAALLAIGALGVVLFYTPIMQTRFFQSGEGRISDVGRGDFTDAGRFTYWEATLDESKEHLVFGAGVGESDIFIRSIFDIAQVHNDFLRILFDHGVVGLSLFLCTIGMQLFSLRRLMLSSAREARVAATASLMGLVSWMCYSATDNPIIYNVYFTYPLFAVIGSAYGLSARPARIDSDIAQSSTSSLSRRGKKGSPERQPALHRN